MAKEITGDNLQAEVLESPLPYLVDFWAPWCAPCRAISRHLEELTTAYAGRLHVGKCDIDSNPGLPAQYDVRALPTLVVFKGGQVVGRVVGAVPRAEIEAMIKKALEG